MRGLFEYLLKQDVLLSQRLRLKPGKGGLFKLAALLAHSGDSWLWLGGLGLAWLFAGSPWRERAAMLGVGVVVLAAVVMTVKLLVRRPRPAGEWGAMYRSVDPHSFPSGHAARAMLLVVLAWGVTPAWFALILSFWTPLVSLARIVTGVHYLSDVLAGLFIGFVVGLVLLFSQPLIAGIFPVLF